MKNITEYITESASLFDKWTGGYANNFLNYSDGDKTFGELVAGDKIYYSYFKGNSDENIKVLELTVKSGVANYLDNKIIRVEKDKENGFNETSLIFGPKYATAQFANGYEYSPEKIKDSSICVSWRNIMVFGTNKESVLNVAKSKVADRIKELKEEVKKLNKLIADLKTKLDAVL